MKRSITSIDFTIPETAARYEGIPCSMNNSNVNLTSSALKVEPSEKVTSSRRLNIAQLRLSGYSSVEHR